MGFFEWIGEAFNPGPVGTVTRPPEENTWQPRHKLWVWVLAILGVGFFSFFMVAALLSDYPWQYLVAFGIYLAVAHLLSPQPHHTNMGWFGGIIDNPFRITDDANRWLFFFALILLPGKIILYSFQTIINTIKLFR